MIATGRATADDGGSSMPLSSLRAVARRPSALALLAVLLSAAPAAAQTESQRATARTLATEGQEALDAKDYAKAADRFTRAEAIIHGAPTLLLGLARAQVGLGKLVVAREVYARIVRDGVPRAAPGAFQQAVRDAKKELDALVPRIPGVIVQIKGTTAARVTIDGNSLPPGAVGTSQPVDPGTHVVRAEADGLAPAEATVTVAERRTETVTLDLAPPARGGQKVADAPKSAGPSPVRTAGFVTLGVGLAGLAVGIGTGVVAMGKHSELAKVCPSGACVGQSDAIGSYHVMTTTSTIGFVAGGALAASGVIMAVVCGRAKPASAARLTPVIGPLYVGAAGRF
jgi:hypothetical protein